MLYLLYLAIGVILGGAADECANRKFIKHLFKKENMKNGKSNN